MKILLEPQIFNLQIYGGISRYFSEVYKALQEQRDTSVDFPLIYSENFHLREHHLLGLIPTLITKWGSRQSKAKRAKLFDLNKQRTIKALQRKKYDLVIPTYYDPYFLPYTKSPFVLTVYDMIHEKLPAYFSPDDATPAHKKLLMDKAAKIIAISHNTKQDILGLYPDLAAEKIEVVHLAQSIKPAHLARTPEFEKYVLFVGNREGYKKFDFFVRAVAGWLKRHNYKLVCAGGRIFTEEEKKTFQNLEIQDRVIQKNFLDSELASFYKGALAFIFPSEYEGFGIPVLEAMACGCPVLLPALSSFPEVAGDAGLYFDLDTPDSLVRILDDLRANGAYRDDVVAKGYEQEKKFSWQKSTNRCIEIFSEVVQRRFKQVSSSCSQL